MTGNLKYEEIGINDDSCSTTAALYPTTRFLHRPFPMLGAHWSLDHGASREDDQTWMRSHREQSSSILLEHTICFLPAICLRLFFYRSTTSPFHHKIYSKSTSKTVLNTRHHYALEPPLIEHLSNFGMAFRHGVMNDRHLRDISDCRNFEDHNIWMNQTLSLHRVDDGWR
jgi:hypothetical protein